MTTLDAIYRWIEVDGFEYKVPKNITRIDPSRYDTNTTGWQLRFSRKGEPYYSKMFSDNVWGNVDEALSAALEEWEKQLESRKSPFLARLKKKTLKGKNLPCGIHFSTSTKKNRRYAEYSFVVTICLPQERVYKSFYIGTENTISSDKFYQKQKEAVAFRLYAEHLMFKGDFAKVSKQMKIPKTFIESKKKEINKIYLRLSKVIKPS